ncbi:MAG: glycosyltransferase [Congregibacter sp.]
MASKTRARPGLEMVGLIPGCGYGDALSQYAAALDTHGLDVSWRPVHSNTDKLLERTVALADVPEPQQPILRRLWDRSIKVSGLFIQVPPDRWHHYWADHHADKRLFTYVAWEVDQLPDSWAPALNRYEKVFVPSRFNQEVLEQGGITSPVEVIPHIARGLRPGGKPIDLGGINDEDYLFYTIGTWTSRKAMEHTIRAFLETFTRRDKVALVIKSEYFDHVSLTSPLRTADTPDYTLTTAWTLARMLADYPEAARIHLIPHRLESQQIDQLHQRGDCFISLTHSEGWGLGAFEAALAGNPVVITGWGGQLEYLGTAYPWLVDSQLTSTDQSPNDGYFHHRPDVHWASADRGHACRLMREVFERPDAACEFAHGFGQRLRARFSAGRIAEQLLRSIAL